MRVFTIAIVLAVMMTFTIAQAGESTEVGQRERVITFLKEKVLGKTLVSQRSGKLDSGRIGFDTSSRTTFTNLVETEDGFMFDVLEVIQQTNYDLDEKGARSGAKHVKDRSRLYRCRIMERKCTKALVGFGYIVMNTYTPQTGWAESVQMKEESGTLIMKQSTVLYSDFFAKGDTYRPGATDMVTTISVRDGKLTVTDEITPYHVDPETLKRTKSGPTRTVINVEK